MYLTVCICVYSFTKREEITVERNEGEKQQISEFEAWVTGNLMVSFSEVGTERGRCHFGEEKPNSVLLTQAFSLWVKLPGRSRLVCVSLSEAGRAVIEMTVDRNLGVALQW